VRICDSDSAYGQIILVLVSEKWPTNMQQRRAVLTLPAEVTGRQHLRSATQRKLLVPRYRLNSFGRRRFSVAGPSTWNSLPDSLLDPELSLDTFKRQLKTYIFTKY